MIKTHGLSHVALSVADPDRSLAFYSSVFGVREYFRNQSTIQVLGPGQYDVIAFERRAGAGSGPGGILHFGFRLTRPEDIDAAVAAVTAAGEPLRSGETLALDYRMPSCVIPTGTRSSSGTKVVRSMPNIRWSGP